MEQVPNNAKQQPAVDKPAHSYTPHELVERHMQHPEEPITDADMENLDVEPVADAEPQDEIVLTPEEKKNADGLADTIQSDSTGISYQADI